MNTIRLLVTTLLVMTSPLVVAEEAKGALTLTPQRVTDWLTLSGTVSAIHQGTVAAQTSGRVSRMLVDVNDEVQAGQPLLEISGKEQSAAVTGAEVNAAEAALIQAREAYGYTRILAPYAGVVTKRLVELGETVAPGTPLLSGFSLGELRVELELPQSALALAGQPSDVQVLLPGGKAVAPVKLTRFNYADSQSHSFRLRLDLPPNTTGGLPGMWLKVQLKQGERQVLQVPEPSLLRQGEFNGVYLKEGEGWALTPVRVGHCEAGLCEVLAGLKGGDTLAPDAWTRQQEVSHE